MYPFARDHMTGCCYNIITPKGRYGCVKKENNVWNAYIRCYKYYILIRRYCNPSIKFETVEILSIRYIYIYIMYLVRDLAKVGDSIYNF